MRLLAEMREIVRAFWFRAREDRELEEELAFHLEMAEKENLRRGMSPAEARRQASLRLGGATQVREATRDARGLRGFDNLAADLRYGMRTLRRAPGFALAAVLTLALGIGATTAIFSVVRSVLLRPLPYDAPDRILQVWNPWSNEPGVSRGRSAMSSADFADLRDAVASFDRVAAYSPPSSVNLTGSDVPERVLVARSTAGLFDVLGADAAIGRTFAADEDTPGRNDVVVLSHALWQRRFGGDRAVLGSVIRLDGVAHRIVGVMPPSFRLPADYLSGRPTEVWKPLALDPERLDRGNQWLHVLGRLEPGASLATANAELAALTNAWIEQGFKIRNLGPYYSAPIEDEIFGGIRPVLLVLSGAVVFVLLIACANVANLLLARGDRRRAEMAVRSALGAGRGRIIAQILTESALLALVGGASGLLLAYVGVEALVALDPANLPRVEDVRIDGATLGFSALVALITALLFGCAPALQVSRPDLAGELGGGSRTATGARRRQRFRDTLIAVEVALSIVLVIGAVLMLRTFAELSRIDLGFDPDGVLTFGVSLPSVDYPEAEDRIRFHAQLTERLESLPGVRSAGATTGLPLTETLGGGSVEIEGAAPPRPGEGRPNVRWQVVTPGYLETLRYARLDGRLIERGDGENGPPAVVVNETMAQMFWPGESAVGKRVRNTNRDVPWFTVVGTVLDVRHSGVVDTPSPTMYIPHEQIPLTRNFTPAAMSFAVRTGSDPLALAGAVRDLVRSLDPNLPLSGMRPMDEIVADTLARPRFVTLLLAIFAAVALALAAVGLYALLSYTVSQRTREIGIRVALGAPQSSVLVLVVGRGLRLTVLGLGAGLVAAQLLTRFLEGLLYGVHPLDPATYLMVPTAFALIALAAMYLPARRAASVDPALALRRE